MAQVTIFGIGGGIWNKLGGDYLSKKPPVGFTVTYYVENDGDIGLNIVDSDNNVTIHFNPCNPEIAIKVL